MVAMARRRGPARRPEGVLDRGQRLRRWRRAACPPRLARRHPPARGAAGRVQTQGWQPPQVAEKWRPELAEFEVIAPFELDAAGPYLSALLPIGAERSYYDGGEDVGCWA
ncbi:MAG: hypothetical protein M5U09_02815 [Gammaproteobacteria bacterium]|nr:hypothetical protein [Gammaproteobacteria bacterium]